MVVSIGIDVSKAKLDVAVLQDDNPAYQQVENNLSGWQTLHQWLQDVNLQTKLDTSDQKIRGHLQRF